MLARLADHKDLEEISRATFVQGELWGGASIDADVCKLHPGKILQMAVRHKLRQNEPGTVTDFLSRSHS